MNHSKDLMEALQRRRSGHLNSAMGAMGQPPMPAGGMPAQMGQSEVKQDPELAPTGDPNSMSPMQFSPDMIKTQFEGARPGSLMARVAEQAQSIKK